MGASHSGPGFQGPAFEPTTAGDPAAVSGHRISARLGASALGTVYLAHAPGGQPVALTVVHPELATGEGFAARFHHDAQEAGRAQAPGALPVLGSGQEGDRFWIAVAYVPALPLDTAVTGQGPLPTRVVLRLVAGLAETLQALHHAGVVHGDLRPAHVLLAADGPKVTGYGTAALADPAADGRGPAFLAPEQAAGKQAAPATDVFALGQVAAYASIGRPPFDDVARIAQDEPDLNELPGELREIVTRCLIKEPGLRPSLAQVVTMCAQAAPPSPHPRPDSWLPPALLAAIVPAMPASHPPAPAGNAAPGGPPAPAPPSHAPSGAAPGPPAAPARPPAAEAAPKAAGAAPGAPHPAAVPAAPDGTGAPVQPSAPPAPGGQPPSPQAADSLAPPQVHGGPVPPAPGAPLPPPPSSAAPQGAGHWGPGALHWPHLPHMPHLPLARPRRRTAGVTAAAVGLILAVGAGVALAGGMGGSGHDGADGTGFGATAPVRPGAPATPSGGAAVPTGPAPTTPVPAQPDPSTPAVPDPGTVYEGIRLQAGSSLALLDDPPSVQPDASGGSFGLSERGDAFVAEPHQARLALPAQGLPPTLDTCRGATGADVPSVPRQSVAVGGGHICVHMTDGTTALVTVRQFLAPAGRPPAAVIDVTVWHQLDS